MLSVLTPLKKSLTWGFPCFPHLQWTLEMFCMFGRGLNFFFIGVQLIYNVVLISHVQQSESVIHIRIRISTLEILFPYRPLENIEQSSLCCAWVRVKSLQLCLTLCNPVDRSLLGFSVHGIVQARILEWAAMPSSRGSYMPGLMSSCFCPCPGTQHPR